MTIMRSGLINIMSVAHPVSISFHQTTANCHLRMSLCRLITCNVFMRQISHPFQTAPKLAEWIQIHEDVLWVQMPLPYALDHINVWLLRDSHQGNNGWALVDTGFALPESQAAWQIILEKLDGPITRIIGTHFHPDHIGLAKWLQDKTGARFSMTAGEYLTAHCVYQEIAGHGPAPMLKQFQSHGLDEPRLEALRLRGNGYKRGVADLPLSYDRIVDRESLKIGNHLWQVLVGYGHSPEHAALYCPEMGMLISGDMLLPRISTNISIFAVAPLDDALQRYLDSLDDLVTFCPEETHVLPSHGLPFYGIQNRVTGLKAHHLERLGLLEENCQKPQTAASLLETLFPRALDTHQLVFAMGEAIAHLNHLEISGRLIRTVGDDGVNRFTVPNTAS
jgi:glyoxylase-like metal-dependent hydrolase (beta-lactamase superfamily II)